MTDPMPRAEETRGVTDLREAAREFFGCDGPPYGVMEKPHSEACAFNGAGGLPDFRCVTLTALLERVAREERERLRKENAGNHHLQPCESCAVAESMINCLRDGLLEWAKRRGKFLGTDDPRVVARDREEAERPLVELLGDRVIFDVRAIRAAAREE